MKFFKYTLISASLLGCLTAAYAASAPTPTPTVGTRLLPAEVTALGGTTRYAVGRGFVTLLPVGSGGVTIKSTDGSPLTSVVNDSGVVGVSRNEVLIAQMPTATVRSQAAALLSTAKSVTYYDHLQITSVRYASFGEAVAGFEKLQAALAKAQVTLPIEYQQRKPR